MYKRSEEKIKLWSYLCGL